MCVCGLQIDVWGEPYKEKLPTRMWSNLGTDMKHEPGSVWGAAALVAGTTVGAGILALPAVTEVR